MTLKRMKCDLKKKLVLVLVKVNTKDGLSDERELMLDWKTGEIMIWANPD